MRVMGEPKVLFMEEPVAFMEAVRTKGSTHLAGGGE